jgi:hypothetical protein
MFIDLSTRLLCDAAVSEDTVSEEIDIETQNQKRINRTKTQTSRSKKELTTDSSLPNGMAYT